MACDIASTYPYNLIREIKLTANSQYGRKAKPVNVTITVTDQDGSVITYTAPYNAAPIGSLYAAERWLNAERKRREKDAGLR